MTRTPQGSSNLYQDDFHKHISNISAAFFFNVFFSATRRFLYAEVAASIERLGFNQNASHFTTLAAYKMK